MLISLAPAHGYGTNFLGSFEGPLIANQVSLVSIKYVTKFERMRVSFARAARAFRVYFDSTTAMGAIRRVHALSITGDTFITVALAGSLFFSISPSAARSKVALYLILTVAPFGIVAPLIGPMLDHRKGARRVVILVSLASRGISAILILRYLNSLLLFPFAFASLVASKTYLVAKAALVPDLVEIIRIDPNDESQTAHDKQKRRSRKMRRQSSQLVAINSSLSLLGAIVGLLGGAVAAGILKYQPLGAKWVLGCSVVIFITAAFQVRFMRPRINIAQAKSCLNRDDNVVDTLGSASKDDQAGKGTQNTQNVPNAMTSTEGLSAVFLAAVAMSVLRGSVGFYTFLLAFNLRKEHAPTYYFGVIIAMSALGSLIATITTPRIRRWLQEELLLIGALILEAVFTISGAYFGGRVIEVLIATTIGFVASAGKLAFDTLVQYNVEPLNQGRAFARFETQFQLSWVGGGLIPVLIAIPLSSGHLILAFTALVAAASFGSGIKAIRKANPTL